MLPACGAVAEWSKALAWKVSIRQKRIEGSNPSRSAIKRPPVKGGLFCCGSGGAEEASGLGVGAARAFRAQALPDREVVYSPPLTLAGPAARVARAQA